MYKFKKKQNSREIKYNISNKFLTFSGLGEWGGSRINVVFLQTRGEKKVRKDDDIISDIASLVTVPDYSRKNSG